MPHKCNYLNKVGTFELTMPKGQNFLEKIVLYCLLLFMEVFSITIGFKFCVFICYIY